MSLRTRKARPDAAPAAQGTAAPSGAAGTSPRGAAEPAARISADRLGSTLFLAGLAHGVVILGITFSTPRAPETSSLPSLNVTLVVDTTELDSPPPDTEWLAQADQEGGGAPRDGLRPTTTLTADQPDTLMGDPNALDAVDGRPREAAAAAEEILTRGDAERQVAAVPKATEAAAAEAETRAALLDRSAPETLVLEIDDVAALPAADGPDALAPSTRESSLAAYLDAWRRRVERVGTVNFPATLRQRDGIGRPTLEVAIGADGTLTEIVVRRSSGEGALDQAALTILRLAAPFDPLPNEITSRYDELRFAYEWDFSGNAPGPTAAVPGPAASTASRIAD